jgi:hypothetical protein
VKHGIDGVPFLRQDDRLAIAVQVRHQHFLTEKRRQGGSLVDALALFAVVDSPRVIAADPLTPAVQVQRRTPLVPRFVRITDKLEMRLIPSLG